jgi:hypothetical protein
MFFPGGEPTLYQLEVRPGFARAYLKLVKLVAKLSKYENQSRRAKYPTRINEIVVIEVITSSPPVFRGLLSFSLI